MNNISSYTNPTNPTALSHSPDALAQRQTELLALLRQTAPEAVSDNQINIEKLKELLGQDSIAPNEHYELNWAGKAAARREIQKTSSHTLLPSAGNPPNAQHMLIEGENLEVLRVLQKSYYGKVKMIYIDPPYNTGNDSFVYPDDYSETLDQYQKRTGEKNEAGFLNKQSLWKKNSKESGQYHSAWLSMMYPRLYLARNLLRDDGVIFISIDDNEAANLKLLCDEVFGAENHLVTHYIQVRYAGKTLAEKNDYQKLIEQVFVYKKNNHKPLKKESEYSIDKFCWQIIEKGSGKTETIGKRVVTIFQPDEYEILKTVPSLTALKETWATGTVLLANASGKYFGNYLAPRKEIDGLGCVYKVQGIGEDGLGFRYFSGPKKESATKGKFFSGVPLDRVSEINSDEGSMKEHSIENFYDFSPNFGNCRLEGGVDFRSGKKPVVFLKNLIEQSVDCNGDEYVLDFFAGSGTTAQAVMELNLEDGGNRQCICVQMPEVLEESSEAYKAGYRTIADITRARIDKVIDKLKAENPIATQDLACAHFTLSPSNFKVWRGDVGNVDALREQLAMFQTAEKDPSTSSGRTAEVAVNDQNAMLAELLLKHGLGALGVHAIAKPRQVAGVTVHRVRMADDKRMWLCFDTYTDALKDEIVKAMPAQVVMLNSCFVGNKADEQLSNLKLELAGLEIGLTVI